MGPWRIPLTLVTSMRFGIGATMLLVLVAVSRASAQSALPDSVLEAAIALGSRYEGQSDFVRQYLSKQECGITGFWTGNGVTREVRLFTDFDVVAAGAAGAKAQMRTLSLEEARRVPTSGLLLVNFRVSGKGHAELRKATEEYGRTGAHVVLQVGDSVMQPVRKEPPVARVDRDQARGAMVQSYPLGQYAVTVATPLGGRPEFEQNQSFAFDVRPEALPRRLTVHVIDETGDRRSKVCDLQVLRTH